MSDRHYVHHENEVQLAKMLKESKPFFARYGTTMIYGVAALMAIAAVVVYFQRQPAPTAEVSRDLLLATTAEDYQAVADDSPDSPIGILARLRQADRELEDAVSNLFTNREAAQVNLTSAAKAYTQLEDRKDITGPIRERVLVGLARVAECRCDGTDGSMKAASAAWDRILTTFPDSKTFKSIAESRVKRLSSTDSREFYAWFSTQNPKPGDDLLMPQDGGPGQVPSTPMFPDLHNFGLPNVDASTPAAPAENPANVETPATETPSDPAAESPATPPATEAPATEAPATEAPATEAPPTEAPVGETPVPEKSGE
ncbi:MAG: hypothetical protein NTX48_17885 [Planctomycetales bacterium]|nr:hypothetical protein [Planctomycetales bacterium]